MADTSKREELIEEAAKAMCDRAGEEEWEDCPQDWYLADARVALAVFEQAHTPTDDGQFLEGLAAARRSPCIRSVPGSVVPCCATPTDDEREALAQVVAKADEETLDYERRLPDYYAEPWEGYMLHADHILAAGFRRTVQGEPTATVATKPAIDEVRRVLDYYADEIDVHIWQEIASVVDDIPDCESWTAVPHAEHVQGEPTDAAVIEAVHAIGLRGFHVTASAMRAALRAAAEQGENR